MARWMRLFAAVLLVLLVHLQGQARNSDHNQLDSAHERVRHAELERAQQAREGREQNQ